MLNVLDDCFNVKEGKYSKERLKTIQMRSFPGIYVSLIAILFHISFPLNRTDLFIKPFSIFFVKNIEGEHECICYY